MKKLVERKAKLVDDAHIALIDKNLDAVLDAIAEYWRMEDRQQVFEYLAGRMEGWHPLETIRWYAKRLVPNDVRNLI
jgi:hypothetical protein